MSGWSCPHQDGELCLRLKCECRPGRPGCVLKGKVVFASDDTEQVHHQDTKVTKKGVKGGRQRSSK